MARIEKRLFRIVDEIERLTAERELVAGELDMLRHLDDDARRDAAVSDSPLDRDDARVTSADVARFTKELRRIDTRLATLQEKRLRLLDRLS